MKEEIKVKEHAEVLLSPDSSDSESYYNLVNMMRNQLKEDITNILLLDKCKTLLGVSLGEMWIWCSKVLNGLLSIIITYSLLNLRSLIEQEIYNDNDISHKRV